MLRSLTSAVSGMQQFQGQLEVIGNNIANSNTLGFKSARAEFEDAFSQTLSAPDSSGAVGVQIGSGAATAAVRNIYTQGTLATTGLKSDLGIDGEGFFNVKDSVTGESFVTRAGDFSLDANGYLVTPGKLRVQGYADSALGTLGDVRIDASGRPSSADPAATLKDWNIASDGKISVTLSDGTTYVRGQVLLQSFANEQALLKQGGNLYGNLSAAGASALGAPGSNGLGTIKAGSLEMSNVDLASEFANLITAQRGFQANARLITTSDEVLQELVSLKR